MKSMMIALISLTAVAAMATQPAAPAAPAAAATAQPATAPVAKQDCTKLTGEAKMKCEAEMKAHK